MRPARAGPCHIAGPYSTWATINRWEQRQRREAPNDDVQTKRGPAGQPAAIEPRHHRLCLIASGFKTPPQRVNGKEAGDAEQDAVRQGRVERVEKGICQSRERNGKKAG